MTLAEIQTAVRAGRRVFWKNQGYEVKLHILRSGAEQWLVTYAPNGHSVGLTHIDGVTLAEKPDDFFTVDTDPVFLVMGYDALSRVVQLSHKPFETRGKAEAYASTCAPGYSAFVVGKV